MKNIWLVVPCYNEEEVLPETSRQLKAVMQSMIDSGKISPESKIAFVNDGSKDNTWNIISALCTDDGIFAGINHSRNKGHQNALLAGLMTAKKYADAVISLDADLQDDVDAIEKMVDNFIAGDDIVYGVRSSRKKDTFFKRFTAEGFYKFMAAMGVEIVFNHADYRLMSRRALDALSEFDEVNLFLRGIVPQIGFRTSTVEYERKERLAGESKYPLRRLSRGCHTGSPHRSITAALGATSASAVRSTTTGCSPASTAKLWVSCATTFCSVSTTATVPDTVVP